MSTKTKKKDQPKASHSHGPWAFTEGDASRRDCSSVYKASDKEFLIAHVICESRNQLARAEDIANARLIAAAPELLQAAKSALLLLTLNLDESDHVPKIVTQLESVIAKAEGGAA